jgi:biotin carboxyl carrier protein
VVRHGSAWAHRARRAGRVTEIAVASGQIVATGELLLRLE